MAGLSLEHPWAFACGLLGNIISFTSLLAPIPTFYRIYKSKSTEGFQSVPYVVALFSAMLWIFYALVKSGEGLLITINAAGCVIETVYIVMYLVYAPRKAKVFTAKIILLLNIAGFGLILLVTLLAFHGKRRVVSLGWICVGFSVCVFVAPLSIIGRVIKTKSVCSRLLVVHTMRFFRRRAGWSERHTCNNRRSRDREQDQTVATWEAREMAAAQPVSISNVSKTTCAMRYCGRRSISQAPLVSMLYSSFTGGQRPRATTTRRLLRTATRLHSWPELRIL